MTECEEVAENMSLDGFKTWAECRIVVKAAMFDQGTQIIDNVTDALWDRYKANWPSEPFIDRILEVTSKTKLGCILRAIFGDPNDYLPKFSNKCIITSDGYIMCGFTNGRGEHHAGAFLGSAHELTRNLIGLCVFMKLSGEEILELGTRVDAWIGTDYRDGAKNPPTLILSTADAERATDSVLETLRSRAGTAAKGDVPCN